ncbi:hypothetical protein AB0N07_20525 [Streptomyces sp. NPDC051172]|uniref:hypothetical protein n=1 Tax=Streptomyces sp. NPDC051172 TaxID=3155796 RepID=UPI003422118E
MIEVWQEVGPAAEPHLGRLLHAAIRAGGTAVMVDLRHIGDLGASGLSVLRLARALAEQHGLPFGFVGDVPGAPVPPASGRQPGRTTAVPAGDGAEERLPFGAAPSVLPPAPG